ncbi:hypothetical protein [Corallococcus sp. EGB]|uniref:hypothetical protein n=1 Tax=Corallococcus sp. EGB TaxID=1521117 RepID=UPI0027149167|nr:hypothetical protein [Corallococcus sp. EGB]
MGGGRHGKGPRTPEPSLRGPGLDSRGEDVRGAVAQVCRDAARLLREGQAARAYSGLVSASRSLPMTPRLAAVLVRCALRAGTERAVITLLDAAMVTERGEVRRAVRRQLSRVLRRTGQEARAAAVLNGLLMDAPDDARARFVLDVMRERVAKAREAAPRQPPAEDDESRTKTVEVSALALSDPELGNTVVEMPVVSVPAPSAWAPRAETVQVPLGAWANPGRAVSRGPDFPWDDDGPGQARVATPPRGARSVPEPKPSVTAAGPASVDARGAEETPAAGEKAGDGARPLSDQGTAASDAPSPGDGGGTSKVLSSADASSSSVEVAPGAAVTSTGPRDSAEGTVGEASAQSHPAGNGAAARSPSSSEVPEQVVAAMSALPLSDASPASERAATASNASPSVDGSTAAEHGTGATSPVDATRSLEHVGAAAASPSPASVTQGHEDVAATSNTSSDTAAASEEKPVAAPPPRPVFEATQVFGKRLEDASLEDAAQAPDEKPASPPPSQEASAAVAEAPSKNAGHDAPARSPGAGLVPGAPSKAFDEDESTSESVSPHPAGPEAEAPAKSSDEAASTAKKTPPRPLDAVLVPGAPAKNFDADEPTSEITPPPSQDASAAEPSAPPRPPSAVLVPGAPAVAFDDEASTSEIIPPGRVEAEKATPSRDEKSAAPRRASVLVPASSKPAFDEDEATSEVVFPQPEAATPGTSTAAPTRDSTRAPSVESSQLAGAPAPDARTVEEGSERAQSQRQEAQLIARRAWRELAQLYLKRADRAKDAPERAEALTRLAEVMENELQDSAGAARMYREIVELTGERTALREQVRLLSQREDASLVRRALDDAISRARTSRARAVALLTRGERQLNMGNAAKAREDFEAADALVPGMLPVLAGLVRSVSDEERFAQVERLRAACAAAPRRAPDRLEALRVLAQTAEESLGDLRIAQWAWAEVLAENPDNDQPREHLLALARRLGDLPALSALLHAQLAREPRGPAARKAHLERVATLEAMGDAGAALAELRQAVRFEPGHKEAWLLLADRCTEREQFGEAAWALENAATATEDDEERQRTWERLALFCREVLHNTEKARLYARRAESLRKAREQRARPPAPEPTRPAQTQAVGVPPPSVLVAPPVAAGKAPGKRKDLSDEVTSNTDVPSLLQAEAAAADAPAKRSSRTKDGAGRKGSEASGTDATDEGKRGRAGARTEGADRAPKKDAGRGAGATPDASTSTKAASASQAPVADGAANPRKRDAAKAPVARNGSMGAGAEGTEAQRRPASGKALVGSTASLAETAPGAEVGLPPKAPSGRNASAGGASPATETPRQPKAPSGRNASVGGASPATETPRQPKATSGRHASVGGASPATETPRQPKAPSGRHGSVASPPQDAEPPRRAASTKAPAESAVSLAESAPAPSGMSRAAKPPRGAASIPAQEPHPAPEAAAEHKPRAAAPPRERTTAFGAALPPDAEPEVRKAAAPEDNASQPQATARNKNAGTQVREAPSRVERAPRAGHAPRVALSASGVEPPAAPRAPLSASGVEPPAPSPRAVGSSSRPAGSKGRGAPEAPPDIPLLSQIPSEDEDEDAQELGAGPVEATSVIAWEAPPGRMDPVRRIHRAGRPEGTVSGPAPTRPQAGGRPTVGSSETRETPAAAPDVAPPADATSAEPIVFKLVRERPLDPKGYRGLVDHFEQRGDATRAALMRELADALEGRDVPAPRARRAALTNQERAGLRHPGLRTPAGELLACVGIALCRLFPSPARIASTSEPLRSSSGPGATAILDALNTAARLLGVPLPELVAGDDDTANITPLHTTTPRLVVGRLLVQQPPTNAELRFHAGRALFSLSPDLLALRALRKDHLLRALALLSSVLKNPKDAGDDARVVRESLSPRALERAALLMEPGTRDFDASLLVAAARDSANRAGLVACGGPGPALTALRARRPHDSELEELVRFAASERYLALRDASEPARGR